MVADKEVFDEEVLNEVVTSETERQAKLNSSGKQKAQRVASSVSTSILNKHQKRSIYQKREGSAHIK